MSEDIEPTTDAAPADPVPTPAVDEVTTKLTELGVDDETITKIKDGLGVATVGDLAMVTEADLVGAGMKAVPARKLVGEFKPVAAPLDAGGDAYKGLLPTVPDSDSWLTSLKTGGVLKVGDTTYIAAIRAALARRVGLFDIPQLLVRKMEEFADGIEEPVDPELFFGLQDQLTRRNYAEIFNAIPGMNGRQVTEARRTQLFSRIDQFLWPAVTSFYQQLDGWQQRWTQGMANPALLTAWVMGANATGVTPPGLMQAPDTTVLRDSAEELVNAINKVFAGVGVQIAAAVAFDATQITKALEDRRLPAMIGAANRDQMLKQLGVSVSAMYPRLEADLTQFVLGAVQVTKHATSGEELQYFGALWMLGTQIPWDQLGVGSYAVTGIGGRQTRL